MVYDVLIIGSGVAGLRAALEVKKHDLKVGVMVKTNPLRSNSSMAAGGVNAVFTGDNDSIEEHIADTLKSAQGLGNKNVIEKMCKEAAKEVLFLKEMGVKFETSDNGTIIQRPFGGSGKSRSCFVADKTGAEIIQTMIMKARNAGIECLKDYFALNIIKHNGSIAGVTAIRKSDSAVVAISAKAVIFAGGGFAGIYRGFSTNPQDSSGDVLAMALRAGLKLRDLEFVQFHPTAVEKSGALITEAARAEGGYIVNSDGERFVDELATRDKVSQAIFNQFKKGKKVFLDLRHLQDLETKLPTVIRSCMAGAGVDPREELIPIKPVAHYTIGGIKTNIDTSTELKGLFACGECASNLVHGANRLGGNSLLDGLVFGRVAGKEASNFAKRNSYLPIDYEFVAKDMRRVDYIFSDENRYNINSLKKLLGQTLYQKVGVYREEQELLDAFDYVEYLRKLTVGLHCINKDKNANFELTLILEFINSLEVAEAMVLSAIKRKESRGAHQRVDFPESDDKLKKHILVEENSKFFKVEFEEKNSLLRILRNFLINK